MISIQIRITDSVNNSFYNISSAMSHTHRFPAPFEQGRATTFGLVFTSLHCYVWTVVDLTCSSNQGVPNFFAFNNGGTIILANSRCLNNVVDDCGSSHCLTHRLLHHWLLHHGLSVLINHWLNLVYLLYAW